MRACIHDPCVWLFWTSRLTSLCVIAVSFHLWMVKSCVCVSPCCVASMPPKSTPPRMDADVSPSESDSDEGGPFYAMHFGANGETLMSQGAGYPSPQAMMLAQFLQGFVQKGLAERGAEEGQALTTTSASATTSGSNDVLMFGNSGSTSHAATATSLLGDSTNQGSHGANDAQDQDALSTQQDAKQQETPGEKKRSKKKAAKKKKNAKK